MGEAYGLMYISSFRNESNAVSYLNLSISRRGLACHPTLRALFGCVVLDIASSLPP